jgi:hypothetical protein
VQACLVLSRLPVLLMRMQRRKCGCASLPNMQTASRSSFARRSRALYCSGPAGGRARRYLTPRLASASCLIERDKVARASHS